MDIVFMIFMYFKRNKWEKKLMKMNIFDLRDIEHKGIYSIYGP